MAARTPVDAVSLGRVDIVLIPWDARRSKTIGPCRPKAPDGEHPEGLVHQLVDTHGQFYHCTEQNGCA